MPPSPTYHLLLATVVPVLVGLLWLFLVELFQPGERTPVKSDSAVEFPALHRIETARFGAISLADAFDPDRAMVWEIHLAALERIGVGLPLLELLRFWLPCPQACPELYEDQTFADRLRFLEDCHFIRVSGNAVRLTEDGWEFLACFRSVRAPGSKNLAA